MELIIILLLCLLATAKVTVQGSFAKVNIKTTFDALFFNAIVFIFSALIFLKSTFSLSLPVFLFGSVFGILTVLFQGFYIKAMSCGNLSLTVLIINLNMIIPILVSFCCYHEELSLFRFLGICLTIVAFFLNVNSKSDKKGFNKWLVLSVLASLMGGGLSVCQKIFSGTPWQDENKAFVACSYAVAGILSLIICILFKFRKKSLSYKINYKVFLFALSVGVILGIFQALNTKAISLIDGTFLFPAYHGGSLILSFVSGALFLKEKTNVKQKVCFLVGIISIILMCLG